MHKKAGKISILNTESGKILTFDNVVFSLIRNNSVYTGMYWDYFTPLPLLYKKANVLVIGLGGGTIPYQLCKLYGKNVNVDVVEISRAMITQSKKFNPELQKDINIIFGDGADYVAKCNSRYDVIILDAYGTNLRIPDEFFSDEFIRNAHDALKHGGILGINYVFGFRNLMKFCSYMRLLKTYFSVYSFSEHIYFFSNLIILAANGTRASDMRLKIKNGLRNNKNARHILKKF